MHRVGASRRVESTDCILKILEGDIKKFCMQGFENYTIHVSLYPTQEARPVFNLDSKWVGWDEYYFDIWYKPPKRIKVRVNAAGEVRIRYKKRWAPVLTYLKQLKPPVDWNAPGGGTEPEQRLRRWEQQARWWNANGKKFQLIHLPPEIREIIYSHFFGEYIQPYPNSKARKSNRSALKTLTAEWPIVNLLQTSRLVYQEASNILFMYKPFLVELGPIMRMLMKDVPLRSNIRRLELALTHVGFLSIFGHLSPGGGWSSEWATASALLRMKLNHLQLSFGPPINKSGQSFGLCQKMTVAWITNAAWPCVRGHPVRLAGYVIKSQKVAFEAACSVEKKRVELWQKQRNAAGLGEGSLRDYSEEVDDEDGGMMLHETAEVEMFKAREPKWQPAYYDCFCETPCILRNWTEDD